VHSSVALESIRGKESVGMNIRIQILALTTLLAGCVTGSREISIVQDYDTPPKALSTPAPKYPYEAIDDGLAGRSTLDFVVTRSGRVAEVAFIEPLDPMLKEAVLEVTRRWRFDPAMRNGVPVDSRLRTSVEFRQNSEKVQTGTPEPR
jgi:protein TonB